MLFGAELRKRTLLACLLASLLQFAYWGLFFWLPNLLASPIDKGGAGMSVVKSTGWLIPIQAGAFIGYLSFGPLADRFGRRRVFVAFVCASAILVPVYGRLVHHPTLLLLLSPVLGCAGHAYWSVAAPLMSELFPTAVRASGQGLGYNSGRLLGALAPVRHRRARGGPARRNRVGAESDVDVLLGGGSRCFRAAGPQQ